MENMTDYGARFRPEITVTDLLKNYDRWAKMLEDESRRIKLSTTERAYIVKNIEDGDLGELLSVACSCIYNMTGDSYFRKFTQETLDRRLGAHE